MGFIDVAFTTIKRTVQGIKQGRCYRLTNAESILALHAYLLGLLATQKIRKDIILPKMLHKLWVHYMFVYFSFKIQPL